MLPELVPAWCDAEASSALKTTRKGEWCPRLPGSGSCSVSAFGLAIAQIYGARRVVNPVRGFPGPGNRFAAAGDGARTQPHERR
jgi:hypothetical protein